MRPNPVAQSRLRVGDLRVYYDVSEEMTEATAPLAKYASQAKNGAVVVTRRGKPLAAVVPLNSDDWEDFVVSQDPGFIEVSGAPRSATRPRVESPLRKCAASTAWRPTPLAAAGAKPAKGNEHHQRPCTCFSMPRGIGWRFRNNQVSPL
jgi:hypothetical protein